VITHYCQKGRPIVVEGRLEQERWKTPAGESRSRLKVVAQRVTFLPGHNGTAREAEPLPDWATEALSDEQGD
jgi:single-strand DNA-binding protein